MLNRRLESQRASDRLFKSNKIHFSAHSPAGQQHYVLHSWSSQLHYNMLYALSAQRWRRRRRLVCQTLCAACRGGRWVGGWVDWSVCRCLRHDKTLAARRAPSIALRPSVRVCEAAQAGFGYKHRGSNVSIGLMSALLVRAY